MAALTVACNDKELVVIGELVDLNIGEGSDNLGLGCKLGALLELKVADGAGQGEVAVDAAKVDETAGGRDARLFSYRHMSDEPVGRRVLARAHLRAGACGPGREAWRVPLCPGHSSSRQRLPVARMVSSLIRKNGTLAQETRTRLSRPSRVEYEQCKSCRR